MLSIFTIFCCSSSSLASLFSTSSLLELELEEEEELDDEELEEVKSPENSHQLLIPND